MTFADWAAETSVRFREEPLKPAIVESAARFLTGARAHVVWAYVRYHPNPTISATFGGVNPRFTVESRVDVKRAKDAIRERPVLEWFVEPIAEGWTVWDVGAYHGTYAITCALRGAAVVAFEPNPDNRLRIRENLRVSDTEVTVYPFALSDTSGIVGFGGDTLEPRMGITRDGAMEVRASRGDDFADRPDAVKIDVEGHECAVLDGMERTLESVSRILVEVHDGVDPDAVRARLVDAGLHTSVRRVDRPQPYVCGVRE